MIPLNEAETKQWLRECDLPVSWGFTIYTAKEARATHDLQPGAAAVKALVPTGRRGKTGAVVMTDERYPHGLSFSHAVAIITDTSKTATAKRQQLREVGVHEVLSLEEIPELLGGALQ